MCSRRHGEVVLEVRRLQKTEIYRPISKKEQAHHSSADLNHIENVWHALGRQVSGQNYPPTNKNTLIRALIEEWDKCPQQLLDNVVQSMVRCVECCITLHGGHIPY
ncbi:transposable element Tcb2 transposase [Trichonephila clavipes]|nr:transposable element Tcb2 transposase [Trichonephila clavipes]